MAITDNILSTPQSAVDCGTLHLIRAEDFLDGGEYTDTAPTDSWVTCDFSAAVPNGTKAIELQVWWNTAGKTLILVREHGSAETTASKWGMTIGWVNANGEDSERCPILAPNGKFDYRRYSAIYPGGFNCTMIGYYL